jgi:hypothetical protein
LVEQLPEDPTLTMQVLLDRRRNTSYIELLQEEDENGREEANDP